MNTYYIQTQDGKEGPFSAGELRKRGISSETLICTEGGKWTPACRIDALKQILNEMDAPLHFRKHEGPKFVFSADAITEPKTRSRITFMQWASIVLLVLNGALYYYKQGDTKTAAKEQPVASADVPVKVMASIQAEKQVKPEVEPVESKVDTTNSHLRNNWSAFIKASHNAFRYYSKYGGIHHLKAIVQNKTAFPLDSVKVSIRYVKRGETFKIEHVTLYDIPEHSEAAVPAPNSKSGTSVELNITEISSEKLNLFYSADTPAAEADPSVKM
jgi:hypothetical protein